MLQTIGFIVGVYAMARLIQVPLEMLNAARLAELTRPLNREEDGPVKPGAFFAFAVGVSGVAVLVLLVLLVVLGGAGSPMPQFPKF